MNNYSIKFTHFLPVISSLLLLMAGYASTAQATSTQQNSASVKNIELAYHRVSHWGGGWGGNGWGYNGWGYNGWGYNGWGGPVRNYYPDVRYRHNHCCKPCMTNNCGVAVRSVKSCCCN